ncbi:hypothetical protein JD844_015003 [Phrynosoma platyrhinos]|uniref:Arginine vasotocin receptor n=1 Tax=Phrynosoma platyrhinos TaxID=52577 RepID=A0ABQ7T731_PHRPL|nr:hypothetical protein JD844_015003 [Phrynosoma platyrhinos]
MSLALGLLNRHSCSPFFLLRLHSGASAAPLDAPEPLLGSSSGRGNSSSSSSSSSSERSPCRRQDGQEQPLRLRPRPGLLRCGGRQRAAAAL